MLPSTRPWFAMLLALAMLSCSTVSSSDQPADSPAAPTPAGSGERTVASPRPSTSPAQAGTFWELRDTWFENADGRQPTLIGIVSTPVGFVAWGPNAFGSAIITSPTGSGWDGAAGAPGQFDGIDIFAMAASGRGIVALGVPDLRFDPGPAASGSTGPVWPVRTWRSLDGRAWVPGLANAGITGLAETIAAFPGGYVAAGQSADGCDVAVWLSDDGLSWHPSDPLEGARGTCQGNEIAVGPAIDVVLSGTRGLVGFGHIPGRGNATWTSSDGVAWAFHPQPQMGAGPGASVQGLATGGPGFVAVGTTDGSDAAVWTSTDGATWTAAPDQQAFRGAYMVNVKALDSGRLVAIGEDASGRFAAWDSADGRVWRRSPPALYVGTTSDVAVGVQMLATDGRVLVAAGSGNRIWVSPSVTPGLVPADVTVQLDGLAYLSRTVSSGTCSDDDNGSGDTLVATDVPVLSEPNPLSVSLIVTPSGQVVSMYLSSDGFVVDVGAAPPNGASLLAVAAGSTAKHGSLTFDGLAADGAASGAATLAGSLAWSC